MHENEESKIARFVSGLRRDIQNVVELYEYTSLEKFVHLAIVLVGSLPRRLTLATSSSPGLPLLEFVLRLVALEPGSAEIEGVLPVDCTPTIKSIRAY